MFVRANASAYRWLACAVLVLSGGAASPGGPAPVRPRAAPVRIGQRPPEVPDQPRIVPGAQRRTPGWRFQRARFFSVQVNVDAGGNNIVGDAANEPSIAVDPLHPNRVAIGWRQFDTVQSSFRQAGCGYSRDSGRTWTFPGVLDPGVFRSDPVLQAGPDGTLYYMNIFVDASFSTFRSDLFMSNDGGITWSGPFNAFGGDKEWFTVDRTGSAGHGNLYEAWNTAGNNFFPNQFSRSTDGGFVWESPIELPQPRPVFGTLDVDPNGVLYIGGQSGGDIYVVKSTDAKFAGQTPTFSIVPVDLGGWVAWGGINPSGLLGQVWVAVDRSNGPTRGNVYVLASVTRPNDILDVMFSRSEDGGQTWSPPVRVNDDPNALDAWQWFGTMSVAPNGRIDVIWNDTRNDPTDPADPTFSQLFYSFSTDGGRTWSPNQAVTPLWNHFLGYPQQNKIGDYYDMVSDDVGASAAYAATFNGEQDVYFLRIGDFDCNGNGAGDTQDIANGTSADINADGIPDECQCLADLDGDFDADLDDLTLLLAAFETCVGQPGYLPAADIDADGCVDLDDLTLLLLAFGVPCP